MLPFWGLLWYVGFDDVAKRALRLSCHPLSCVWVQPTFIRKGLVCPMLGQCLSRCTHIPWNVDPSSCLAFHLCHSWVDSRTSGSHVCRRLSMLWSQHVMVQESTCHQVRDSLRHLSHGHVSTSLKLPTPPFYCHSDIERSSMLSYQLCFFTFSPPPRIVRTSRGPCSTNSSGDCSFMAVFVLSNLAVTQC